MTHIDVNTPASITEISDEARSNVFAEFAGRNPNLTTEQVGQRVAGIFGSATPEQIRGFSRREFGGLFTGAPTTQDTSNIKTRLNDAGFASSGLTAELAQIQEQADKQRTARGSIIESQFEREIAEQRRIGKAEVGGTKAQLAVLRGAGASSSRQAFIQQQREANARIIGDLQDRKASALLSADVASIDQVRADIKAVRDRDFQERQAGFNNALALITSTANREEQTRIATNQVRDDARSILSLVLTNFSGIDVSSLPDDLLNSFAELEQQAGLPVGFTRQGLTTAKEQASLARQTLAQDKQEFNEQIQNLRLEVSQFRANLAGAQQATGNTIIISPTGETFNIAPHKSGGGTSSISNDLFGQAQNDLSISIGEDGRANTETYKKWFRVYRNNDPIRGTDAFLVDFPLTMLNLDTDQSAIDFVKSLITTGEIKETDEDDDLGSLVR